MTTWNEYHEIGYILSFEGIYAGEMLAKVWSRW